MIEGQRWLSATVIENLASNVYNVLVHEFECVWKRHANLLLSIPEPVVICNIIPSLNLLLSVLAMCRRRQTPNRLTYC